MTHENTISTLARLRECALKDAADVGQIHAEYLEYAAGKADEVLAELEQAGDYSRLLRELDPEHAGNYPDPTPAGPVVHPVVAALRGLADELAALELPEAKRSIDVEVSFHGSSSTAAGAFMAALVGAREGWVLDSLKTASHGTRWLTAHYAAQAGVVEVTAYLEDAPEPEPFVKASPAEVAAAYASSAEYNRALTAREAEAMFAATDAADDARSAVAS